MNEVLAISEEALTKDQPEGNLGDFVADCLLEKTKIFYKNKGLEVNALMMNNGGLRTSLPKGDITKGKIFELMPFDNELVLISIKGNKINEILNFICEKGGVPVSGIKMEIDKNKKPTKVLINDLPIDTNKTYGIISSDYLAEGGDNINFFRECTKNYSGILVRDAIIDHCRELSRNGKKISVKLDGRISFSK
jgi:2',3'-cyclic-nucleotide 2'-phosphodiesterase (5'-nucleotidase family)